MAEKSRRERGKKFGRIIMFSSKNPICGTASSYLHKVDRNFVSLQIM